MDQAVLVSRLTAFFFALRSLGTCIMDKGVW
jgi:hypothetical protein